MSDLAQKVGEGLPDLLWAFPSCMWALRWAGESAHCHSTACCGQAGRRGAVKDTL